MRNENALFWREAARSLPRHVQSRYAGYFQAAEAWELAFDDLGELLGRIRETILGRAQAA